MLSFLVPATPRLRLAEPQMLLAEPERIGTIRQYPGRNSDDFKPGLGPLPVGVQRPFLRRELRAGPMPQAREIVEQSMKPLRVLNFDTRDQTGYSPPTGEPLVRCVTAAGSRAFLSTRQRRFTGATPRRDRRLHTRLHGCRSRLRATPSVGPKGTSTGRTFSAAVHQSASNTT